jgi:DegV family protein with EDD domain
MINILTDSTADIPKDLLTKYHIDVLPMYVQLNGRMYHDGENITAEELFEWVKATGKYPSTSAPPPTDFKKFFDRKDPSIYIGVSRQLSTTMANAQMAITELNNHEVDIIDSKSISIAYGKIVLQAAKWRDQGMGFNELGVEIRRLISRSKGIFILNSLEYLYHGGRCSAINHFAASLLKIRPFLQVLSDGSLGILKKVRGSRSKAVEELFAYFKEQYNRNELTHISIGHLDGEEEAAILKKMIHDLGFRKEILVSKIGCVLASHSGPKPLGIAYSIVDSNT